MGDPPTIRDARALTKSRRLTGALIIGFSDGNYSVASYGSTKARCAALRKLNDAIGELIDSAEIDLAVMGEAP